MDKHWSHALSHALGTPWQQLLLGWQTAALQQLREQILFSNRLGLRGAGFKMDPPLDPALTATVSPSRKEKPGTLLNQTPSPTPQLNLSVWVQTDVTMLYKPKEWETGWYFCFPLTVSVQNQVFLLFKWLGHVQESLWYIVFHILYFQHIFPSSYKHSGFIQLIFFLFFQNF